MTLTQLIRNWSGSRILQYLLFWAFSFIFLLRIFSNTYGIELIDVIYTFLFHFSLVFAVCLNSFMLIPQLFSKKRYVTYGFSLVVLLFVATWLNIFTFNTLADWIFPGYYFISYFDWTQVIQIIFAYVAVTTLLQLSRSWFRETEIKSEMVQLEQEKTQNELKALKAQVNPHFLFNSLNHIYALAMENADQTADATLRLSELLRYAIRKTNQKTVKLSEELDYLEKYTDWHRSRLQHPERVHFSMQGDPGTLKIAPLLLVVFVENCFKHGVVQEEDEFIRIEIRLIENVLHFRTVNSVDENRDIPDQSIGTGVENAKRRLELLYPGRYALEISPAPGKFTLHLQLELA